MNSKKFDKSKFIRNEEVVKPRYYFGDKFEISSGVGDVWECYTLDDDIAKATSNHHDLGCDTVRCPDGPREWAYTFFLPRGAINADGHSAPGGFDKKPSDRKEAYELLKAGIEKLYGYSKLENWESLPGHFLWQHYSCEWGAGSIGSEIGESISSIQTHTAFCRGAARQYGIPWCQQFSFWHQGAINDYTGKATWGQCSYGNGGHSPSLYARSLVAAYMGGASHFYPEACIVINFRSELDENGLYKLSPVGEMSKKLNRFVNNNRDIGIKYVPFGIVLNFNHGMFPGDPRIKPKKIFQEFDFNMGDDMNYYLFDKLFPNTWITFFANESTYAVNSPYGDNFDVILDNASQEVLDSYPCLILSGTSEMTYEDANRYRLYVKHGGTLILNTAYLHLFPEYAESYHGRKVETVTDNGKVIIYGPDYQIGNLDTIIKQELARLIPFEISDQVEYFVNVKDNSLILTLINNEGYYYNRFSGEDIDLSGTKKFTVKYIGDGEITSVKELWSGKELKPEREQVVTLKPGEFKLLEFKF